VIPLDLYMEVEAASGARYRWDANQPAASRLRNVQITTKLGEGFSTLSGNLARRIDVDYPDLRLNQFITVVGADGHVVFEGRLVTMPREVADSHSISVTFVGHMAHAADRFSETYVDRDLAAWGAIPLGRRVANLSANFSNVDSTQTVDESNSQAAVLTEVSGAWASPFLLVSEAWYDAGSAVQIAKITYSWKRHGSIGSAAPWVWDVDVSSDDKGTVQLSSGNLVAAGPSTNQTFTPTSQYRYAFLHMYYFATPGGADGATYGIEWSKLAVYGNHGLTLYTGEPGEPGGVYASDVLKDVAKRFCPLLDTSGVEDTNYVIQHLKFNTVFPHDAFLEVNKYHLNHLAVWEDRTLTFRPYDLSDYQWEIRTDDPGVTFSPVGLSAEDLFNGIMVTFKDILTGVETTLTPPFHAELRDESEETPWNEWGIDHWDLIELSAPTTWNQALQLGRAKLAETNRPKTPGTLSVTGYIRDRQGHPQPASYPRAGDVICITNFNEINRLIVETDWDDEAKSMKIAVDLPFQLLEALFDRQQSALNARGLG
jgi:hypothetical protein